MGPVGIVLFRGVVYLFLVTFIYRFCGRGNPGPVPLTLTVLLAHLLTNYPNERPAIFTFLLFPLLLFSLERVRLAESLRSGSAMALPALMLLWANLHPGYLLGVGVIGVYAVGHMADAGLGRAGPAVHTFGGQLLRKTALSRVHQ